MQDDEDGNFEENQNNPMLDLLLMRLSMAIMPESYHQREDFVRDVKSKQNANFINALKEFLKDNHQDYFFIEPGSSTTSFNFVKEGKNIKLVKESKPSGQNKQREIVLSKKCYLFINLEGGRLTKENIPQMVHFEIGSNPLKYIYNLSNEVFVPVLQNPSNQKGWTDLIAKDLMEKLNTFNANMYLTIGQINGKTLLPLPPKKIMESEDISVKDKADIFNNSIITWMKQIRKVLDTEPEQNLKAGNNPGPDKEIEFWQKKAENLNSIHEQLKSDKIKLIIKTLRDTKSTYASEFDKQVTSIKKARDEANDNYMYLRTLSGYFDQLRSDNSTDFTKLPDLFMPIMKVILLIWERSTYYNKPARLVVLIREICNAIIDQALNYVPGPEIFSMIQNKDEVPNACKKLQTTIDVCAKFKDSFFHFKGQSKNSLNTQGWGLPTNALFIRLDSFLERCHDIMHISDTILQFNKLENIQIGGTKGKNLTSTVRQIFNEFNKAVHDFHSPEPPKLDRNGEMQEEILDSGEYDPMDISKKTFDEHFFLFRNRIKELERRLAAVITQSFEDTDTLIDKFRLLDSFDELLKRPIIQDELEKKHIVLIETYKRDLKTVQEIFVAFSVKPTSDNMDERALYKNLPPVAGTLNWTRSLSGRITAPLEKLSSISPDIKEKEEYKDVEKMMKSIDAKLSDYEKTKLLEWEKNQGGSAHEKLEKFLLVKDESNGTLKVNFDPALISLMREVKYLKMLDVKIPEEAEKVYKNSETYRKQLNKLDIIVDKYNFVVTKLEVVEEPLIASKIEKLNVSLKPGIEALKWKSPEVDSFISSVTKQVNEVHEIVESMKNDLEHIRLKLSSLVTDNKQIMERKSKPVPPEDFLLEHSSFHDLQVKKISAEGSNIQRKIKDITDKITGTGNNSSATAFKKSKEYRDYQEFINDIVIDGLSRAICTSLQSLNKLIEISKDNKRISDSVPLFDVRLDIMIDHIQFEPDISNPSDPKSIRSIMNRIVNDYVSYACLINRIDTNTGDYINEMHDNFEIRVYMAMINENVNKIVDRTNVKKNEYEPFKMLWQQNPDEAFKEFLQKELPPSMQAQMDDPDREDPDKNNPIMEGITTRIPPFETFDRRIEDLKKLKKEVLQLPTSDDIEWLRINSNPLKSSLESKVDIWINMYTKYFLNQVKTFLTNCEDFKKYLMEGTKIDPSQRPEDSSLLRKTMEVLGKEKIVNARIQPNCEFIKRMIQRLKDNDVEMRLDNSKSSDGKGEDFALLVDDLSSSFMEINQRKILNLRNSILPLKTKETQALKNKISAFTEEMTLFRQNFMQQAPFEYYRQMGLREIDSAYDKLDNYYIQIEDFRKRAKELNLLEILFEVEQTKYRQISDCQQDIEKLKTLWDMISVIRNTYESWMRVPWKKLNVASGGPAQEFTEENLTFQDLLKRAVREVKLFKGYNNLNEEVMSMKKILNCITQLATGKLEKHHWEQLAKQVAKPIEINNPNFNFLSFVDMDISSFEPFVVELNETALKESIIGKTMNDISKTWKEKMFQFEVFQLPGEDIRVIKQFDDVQNDLSTDNLKVLNLLSQGKSVDNFRKELNELKEKLGAIDDTLVVWEKVQKNWKRLVNIFMLSEDIRNQLPEATKIFEQRNNEFRGIMSDAQQNPIMIDICTKEKKEELEGILKAIEGCEKQLNQYLEQKKKIFPRFYFVSNQTLIDILSNGTNPAKIAQESLGDLFDGLKKLVLIKGKESDLTVRAEAMYSKDDEIVKFFTPFEPSDAVETWLNRLELKMRETLENYLVKAKDDADEVMRNPDVPQAQRMDWIFNYCAQIALLVVQTIWTEDVQQAFDDIEGGMSNAMKDCLAGIRARISRLITKVRGTLTPGDRNKIITIITIDVHSRDAVEKLVLQNINDKENFQWSSQLKFFLTKEISDVLAKGQKQRFEWEIRKDRDKAIIRIVDWSRFYSYEYIGNCGRLVITPLTDRCYITLTQALGLCMGGAPAGPAGTGKTETTKDLGRAIGLAVFVFNCSEQMSTDSLGQNFMGLSQTGTWGCFDEFNRISIEVLSVVSTQVKQIQDALKVLLRTKEDKFMFMEDEISLQDTVGLFITMNPGYAGRTELPESLKALFRSCAMVVPDLVLISENMLLSEGYDEAKELAKKFVTIYILSRSLLSKQKHYDWGLRAVKSVLRQAGKLKRAPQNATVKENPLLMRALNDFNMPKIYIEDKPIFTNLLRDLFKGVEMPQNSADDSLKKAIQTVAEISKLQPEDTFCLKCVQLSEILEVRHCVFVIGPPGCGKSAVWKTLLGTYKYQGQDTEKDCLDPKAVTSNDLFGVLTKTKEFKNGVLSSIIRNQSKELGKYKPHHKHKWTILDGDIDPEWIESLNTVMDDNKVLTLVSNDRFPMSASMRLIFEISNLKNATPATVSRAGVLYINDSDIGWKPYFDSWLQSHREDEIKKHKEETKNDMYRKAVFDQRAQSVLMNCFRQLEAGNEMCMVRICPVVEIQLVQSTCAIIDELVLEKFDIIQKMADNDQKSAYEGIFYFAAMWAYGGPIAQELVAGLGGQERNYYKEFNDSWKQKAKIPEIQVETAVKAYFRPVYDFYFDVASLSWKLWEAPEFELEDNSNFLRIFVPTIDTIRLRRLVELHVLSKKPILFIGSAGTGKTALINQYLTSVQSSDTLLTYNTNFSSKTSSESLQANIMNSGIGKLGTRFYGLSGRTLVFFIDDFNMPYVDKYGTQSPIALLRQIIDYGIVYDRQNLEEYITLQDIYFCGCMNPKAGSFTIETRLQRHFSVFAVQVPDELIVKQIYKTILEGHFDKFKFNPQVNAGGKLVDATYTLFNMILNKVSHFSPTAQKFHYQFNLRDLSRITEGMMEATPTNYNDKLLDVFKLWVHECRRVFEDRLIFAEDITIFKGYLAAAFSQLVSETPYIKEAYKDEAFADNNLFTSFISVFEVMDDRFYLPIRNSKQLKDVMQQKLDEYNESNSQMKLVLFDEAIQHVCRIARIIERPGGNALLVGVGGSGKQSLTRLATFIQGQELDPIKVTSSFKAEEFNEALIKIFRRVTKPPSVSKTLLATDVQLSNELILVYLNEILNSGYIPGLWEITSLKQHLDTLKKEATDNGFKDNIYPYFVEKIRRNLHVCLCMSPVGDTLRIRARKFPGIINQSQIDWFHSWPQTALYDVAYSFLKEMELPKRVEELDMDIRQSLAENMADTHLKIDQINKEFLITERRYNYTTPKSFLELIEFYKTNYQKNNEKINEEIISLQRSLLVLRETREKVEGLKLDLEVISREVEEKRKKSEYLLGIVNIDKAEAEEEQRKADVEQQKTNEAKNRAEKIAAEAQEEYLKAKPLLDKAEESLANLSDQAITVMKGLPKPTPNVLMVGRAMLYLLDKKKGIDLYNEKDPNKDWPDVQKMMKEAKGFKRELISFADKDAKVMEPKRKDYLKKMLTDPTYEKKNMLSVSEAAANLCDFIHSIVAFSNAYQIVAPLLSQSKEAQQAKEEALKQLEVVIAKVNAIKAKVAELEKKLNEALEEKRLVEEKRNLNFLKMQNAENLVNGMSSNQTRWQLKEQRLQSETLTVIGDSLLAAEFVSYIGPFSAIFRRRLWKDTWLPKIYEQKIPITDGIEPMKILTNSDTIAKWKNEGLPEDQMSIENAAIITSSNRWPLIIDPQLQGGNWISGHVSNSENFTRKVQVEAGTDKEEVNETSEQLLRISMNAEKWEVRLEEAIQMGRIVLLENVTQDIDPILDPLLSRAFIYKKGSTQPLIMFTKEDAIHYNPNFRLFLQCKLSNPHFKPETAAQCSIINFIVTESGLEDQLLALVVDIERPELERSKIEVMRSMNNNAVELVKLDTRLRLALANANPDTILDDQELITTLNRTKDTSAKIEEDTEKAIITEKNINEQRNNYRPVAAEGAMLYFLIISLNTVNHMYQYSLDSFHTFFHKGIKETPAFDKSSERIQKMVLVIREQIYQWISRGLFERHKITFMTLMTFKLMNKGMLPKVEFTDKEMRYLLTCIPKLGQENPVKDWLKGAAWNNALRLAELNGFEKLPESMGNELASRFKEWYSDQNPEIAGLPPSWKFVNQQPFKKLLVLRALRPDRMIPALSNFIKEVLPEGEKFVGMDQNLSFSGILQSTYKDATQEGQLNTPIFFILSPGADPVREVEKLGEEYHFTTQRNNFFNISLGQGQDIIANAKLEISYKEGCWIMLQNIHLMPSWLPTFEKILDKYTKEGGANDRFRMFLSAEPNDYIPIGILEKCIKLTNEPPAGLKANMKRAWNYFSREDINDKDTKIKAVLFGLCYFHSVLIERRKFGPRGWNMFYPFNIGDLRDSAKVLENNIDPGSGRLPWADFKYIFGEIMYGGHIVDDWDRRLCAAYLENLMVHELLSEEFELIPYAGDRASFKTPAPNVDHQVFQARIESALTDKETPMYYGLHPNAEIDLGTTQCNTLFETLVLLQPAETTVKPDGALLDKVTENIYITKVFGDYNLHEKIFNLEDIKEKVADSKGPYQNVFLQECEYMNYLLEEIVVSLSQLRKAKEGKLTFSERLEKLEICLNQEKVPESWAELAYPAKRSLATWFENLTKRIEQLSQWKDDPQNIPKVTRLNLLFNPQSFLTAIKQVSQLDDLNKLYIVTDFGKKTTIEQVETSAKAGSAYCYGFLLDGASWDIGASLMNEARPKEMYFTMPVCRCISTKMPDIEREDKSLYQCPVYRTEARGNTYIFTAQLKTPQRYDPRKWVLAGVAMILDVEGVSDEAKVEKDEKR